MIQERNNSISQYLLLILESFVFFFYFYKADLSFLGVPSALHSIRIVAVFSFVYYLLSHKVVINKALYAGNMLQRTIKFNLFILCYCFLIIMSIGQGTGRNITDDIINQLLFGFLMIWPLVAIFKSVDQFMNVLLGIHIIQSAIVWACVANPHFMFLLDATVNASDWYSDMRGSYAGGIGCITSAGAVKFAFAFVPCLYKYYKNPKWFYYVLFALFAATISMIARTGLILSGIAFLFMLLGSNQQKKFTKVVTALMLVIGVFIFFNSIDKNSSFYQEHLGRYDRFEEQNGLVSWVTDLYLAGDETIIPPLSSETIIGTTVTSGTSGNGIVVNADGGYIRSYVALGLPLAIIFYAFIFYSFIRVARSCNSETKKALYFCTIIFLIGEFKEPYMFSIVPWTTFYLIAILSQQENENITII